jgi:hypothetical protein
VLVWMLMFAAEDVSGFEPPDSLERDHVDQQEWGLYAPDPNDGYSWYVPEAELANGSEVHALNGGQANYDRPPDAAATYETFRHRKYLQTVDLAGEGDRNGIIARTYADWVCEQANNANDDRVVRVTVYQMYQPSPIGGEYEEEAAKIVVIDWDCQSSSVYERR